MAVVSNPVVRATGLLHQRVTEAIGAEVRVDLGPLEGTTESLDAVVIGMSTEDVAVLTGTVEYPGARGVQEENAEISCMAQSVSGDGDLLARLERCFELMDLVSGLVVTDEDEGITWGRVTRHTTQWVKDKAGVGALVIFTIGVEIFRRTTIR